MGRSSLGLIDHGQIRLLPFLGYSIHLWVVRMEDKQLQAEIGTRIPLGAVAAQLSLLAIVVRLSEQRYPTFLFSKFSQTPFVLWASASLLHMRRIGEKYSMR